MRFLLMAVDCALLPVLALALCGCLPSGHSQLDEEKEPHFLAGKSRVTALDYQGGLECFEKAIEANPRSGLAHFEAAVLCEKHKQNFAAAIYHFERYLELRPGDRYADVVKQHIMACKQELAKTVYLAPMTQSLQREFEILSQQNRALRDEVERWKAKALAQAATPVTAPAASSAAQGATPGTLAGAIAPPPASLSNSNSVDRQLATAAASRMHTIKSGETPAAIARRYGLRVNALMAANPRMDARRLQVGQTLVLPSHQN